MSTLIYSSVLDYITCHVTSLIELAKSTQTLYFVQL